jgi:hypothetical protein
VDVGAQTNVVGEVIAGIIRIVIDHDVVVVPQPVVGIVVVVGRNLEEVSANIKALVIAAS